MAAQKTIPKLLVIVAGLFLSGLSLAARKHFSPDLTSPRASSPVRLLLRPVVPLQELLRVASQNEGHAQKALRRGLRIRRNALCSLSGAQRKSKRAAFEAQLDEYARSWQKARDRFEARIRDWIASKDSKIPEFRQERLLKLRQPIHRLQEKRHRSILAFLRQNMQKTTGDGCASQKEEPPKAPALFFRPLYLARYEFWKRLQPEERLRLFQIISPMQRQEKP